ncbi:MAG: hypothetical protein A3K30_02400 [Deltaproteobacteria bacterium RBG_13_51_10]|nr:MAG: hypothetical protein A3K30_02400 [Deltaproteobacteria bacterium RBG_13_51_10]
MTFSKILVANRGEIATRILRSLKENGIRAVAIYSEADKDSQPVQIADEAYLIGPPPASKSYLNAKKIVELAKQIKAEAIHPGYGFWRKTANLPLFVKNWESPLSAQHPKI